LGLAEAQVETNDLAGAMANVNLVRARAAAVAQGCGKGPDATSQAALVAKYPQCATDSRMAVPINDPTITWALYRVSPYTVFPSQQYARDAVQAERRLELAMEGQRFFDLRRTGTYKTVLNGYLTGIGGGKESNRRAYLSAAEPLTDRHRWYPIPSAQIDLSKVAGVSALKQNPGWGG
jgi:starch-binding outer membrane protein, SusD/RagB family